MRCFILFLVEAHAALLTSARIFITSLFICLLSIALSLNKDQIIKELNYPLKKKSGHSWASSNPRLILGQIQQQMPLEYHFKSFSCYNFQKLQIELHPIYMCGWLNPWDVPAMWPGGLREVGFGCPCSCSTPPPPPLHFLLPFHLFPNHLLFIRA